MSNNTGNTAPSVPSGALQVPDDVELMRRVGHGDEGALRELMDRQGPYLYGIAHALAGNAADAEDLVQDTFAGALNGSFRGESRLRTWLVAILVRRAGMLRRSRWRQRCHCSLEQMPAGELAAEITTSPETAGTDARLDLSTMLEGLSPEHRVVIVLRELEGMTYEEMAAALSVPRGTVESRLHRARDELRRRFKGYL